MQRRVVEPIAAPIWIFAGACLAAGCAGTDGPAVWTGDVTDASVGTGSDVDTGANAGDDSGAGEAADEAADDATGTDPDTGGTGGETGIDPTYPPDGFCGEGDTAWAFCEDFDGRGEEGPEPAVLEGTGLRFHLHGHSKIVGVTCEVSGDCDPYFEGGTMLTNAEDSGFGWSAIRPEQPFDFAGREGHLRFTTTFNTTGRMNLGVILTPIATNSMPDNRRFTEYEGGPTIGAVNGAPALAVKAFRTADQGGRAVADVQVWNAGEQTQFYGVDDELVIGLDTTLPHEVDVFVSRTHLRVLMDGEAILDKELDDIGFDRAYVYLAALSYNAMKENDWPHTREANTTMWDNIAFDGPVLAANSLTPEGMQDVVFRAHAVSGCTVAGVAAEGPLISFYQNTWIGWTARVPADAGTITADDITCTLNDWPRDAAEPQWGDIQIVER
jgi:hypothetical protein